MLPSVTTLLGMQQNPSFIVRHEKVWTKDCEVGGALGDSHVLEPPAVFPHYLIKISLIKGLFLLTDALTVGICSQ